MFNNKIIIPIIFISFLFGCGSITWTNGYTLTRAEEKAYSYKIMNNKKLEWSDFTGKPDHTKSWTAASIYLKIFYTTDSSYNYALPGEDGEGYTEPNLKVYYAMDERSWVKNRYKNDAVLNHEEGHLNIAKMCALDFQKTVQLMKPIRRFNCKGRLDSIQSMINGKSRQIQDMYDVETNHGLNKEKQQLWDEKIAELINKLQQK